MREIPTFLPTFSVYFFFAVVGIYLIDSVVRRCFYTFNRF